MKRLLTTILAVLMLCFALPAQAEDDAESLRKSLEQRYDVTIEMGEEITNLSSDTYEIRITPEGVTPFQQLAAGNRRFYSLLKALEDAFSAYPPGFFSRFRIPHFRDRLRFRLVDEVLREGVAVSGYQSNLAGFIDIILARNDARVRAIHHEIGHAIRWRIMYEDYDAFLGWADLNPEHFVYTGDFSVLRTGQENDEPEDWFVREYAKINPYEDMATVFEAVMLKDEGWWAARPHLQEKRQFLLEKMRPVFGELFVRDKGEAR